MTKGDLMQSDSPSGLVMQPKAVTSPHKCRVSMLAEEQRRDKWLKTTAKRITGL